MFVVPEKGTLNASAERDILNDFMLPTTLEQFGGGSFLHTTAQSKIYKDLHEQVWCGRTGLAYTESPPQLYRTSLR